MVGMYASMDLQGAQPKMTARPTHIGRSLANVIYAAVTAANDRSLRLVPGDIVDVFGWDRAINAIRVIRDASNFDSGPLDWVLDNLAGRVDDRYGGHRRQMYEEPTIPASPPGTICLIDRDHDTLMTPGKSMVAVIQAAAISAGVDAGDLVDVFGFRRALATLRWLVVERPEVRVQPQLHMNEDPLQFYPRCDSPHWDPVRPKLAEIERGLAAIQFLPARASVENVIVECDRILNLGRVS